MNLARKAEGMPHQRHRKDIEMKERNSTAAISVKAPVIGLPRAMLYDRYEVLWKSFFSALGMKGIVSKPTNKAMIEAGSHWQLMKPVFPLRFIWAIFSR